VSLFLSFFLCSAADAAEPVFPFETQVIHTVPAASQAWHSAFERNKDYAEVWFMMVDADDGAVLFASLMITNLGLKTFGGIIDMQFYPADGSKHYLHKELNRDRVKASTTKMDVTIEKARVWRDQAGYHLRLRYEEMDIDLDIVNKMPSVLFGNGKVSFFEDKSAEWGLGIDVPYGKASGNLEAGGKLYSLKGNAYQDHGYATIKTPDFVREWRTLRIYKGDIGLALHHQLLTKRFGGRDHRFGVFSADGKTNMPLYGIELEPTAVRKHRTGYEIPTAYALFAKAEGYTITGQLEEARFLDDVDVLGQVSWPVRMLIKAFYADPYIFRSVFDYDLDIIGPDNRKTTIEGQSVVESNSF
jgi:hypothetical protein